MRENYSEQRRDFLKTLAILGGATISLGILTENTSRKKLPAPQPQSLGLCYRETEHIRKYYETTLS